MSKNAVVDKPINLDIRSYFFPLNIASPHFLNFNNLIKACFLPLLFNVFSSLLGHENFCDTNLELLWSQSCFINNRGAFLFHGGLFLGVLYQELVPMNKFIHTYSDAKSLFSNSDCFQHACRSELLANFERVKFFRRKFLVRFDASDVFWRWFL